jgi:competence ComEA-like helix-hairpin-helix protein
MEAHPDEMIEAAVEEISEEAVEEPFVIEEVETEVIAEVAAEVALPEVEEEAVPEEAALEMPPEEMIEEIVEGISEEAPEPAAAEELVPEEAVMEAPPEEEIEEITEPISEVKQPAEPLPELPSWLAEEPTGDTGPLEWMPPEVILDLNQASLADLERLPGIGFIMAQRIIAHRERVGRFEKIDDLLEIPDFDQATLEELKARLYIEAMPEVEPAPEPELPAEAPDLVLGEAQAGPALAAARKALNQGEMETAIQRYSVLTRSKQSLPDVIQDLQSASEHYPQEFEIWQCLGDAYLRSDQIQEALAAYRKAEELLL